MRCFERSSSLFLHFSLSSSYLLAARRGIFVILPPPGSEFGNLIISIIQHKYVTLFSSSFGFYCVLALFAALPFFPFVTLTLYYS